MCAGRDFFAWGLKRLLATDFFVCRSSIVVAHGPAAQPVFSLATLACWDGDSFERLVRSL